MNLHFIIPSFNDFESLPRLVKEIETLYPESKIILIDDGSIPPIQGIGGIVKIRHSTNCGVGWAIGTGLRYSIMLEEANVIVLDADGQHLVSEVSKLTNELKENTLVLGVRNKEYEWGKLRKCAQSLLNILVSIRIKKKIDDCTSGMRAISFDSRERMIANLGVEFLEDTCIALIKAHRSKINIVQTEIKMVAREYGKASHVRWSLAIKYFNALLKVAIL